ncbi:C40 family peptidase [Yinghuangia soli]|uniref:NlpC/P60 family protein n=1 Tax=Yinghuangia soli TaxID=2908204 RepID=A0AA41U409_9ACTN|nr:C40 family peptidase [Yinghuangia soli]MCF2533293.1 NlpC/P60 family protein [Yinghuangia soli]
MASRRHAARHRRTTAKPGSFARPGGAATLATAAATLTGLIAFGSAADAEPTPSKAEVQAQINQLHREVTKATDVYNGVQEKIDTLQKEANATQTRVVEEQASMNRLREQIGAFAAEQYRTGGMPPELRLALSGDPAEYLQKAQMLDQLDSQQAARVQQIAAAARVLQQDRAEASAQLAALELLRKDLTAQKTAIQEKLNKAQALLNTLSEAERQAVLQSDDHDTGEGADTRPGDRPSRDKPAEPKPGAELPNVPASERAAQAIAFARAQLGKPYGWGKAGPSSYDCSGLTQSAWAAAGVKLPRTTWDQIKGTRVDKSQLQPGDLVFFYSDISHVGLYIGGGQMIHAPRPGTVVNIAPISQMPFYGAVRPG